MSSKCSRSLSGYYQFYLLTAIKEISQVISGQQFFSKLEVEINKNINNGENPDYERKVIGVDIQSSELQPQELYTYMQISEPPQWYYMSAKTYFYLL